MSKLKEIALLFLKLGIITFGGPAVHIALFEDEVVTKKKWMSRQHFLDLLGATNLIPGPNSTEMAMHCGYHHAGIPGLFVAGFCFTFPAILITGVLAFVYFEYGNIPDVKPFLYGIKPAVIIIILNAVYKLGLKAVKGWKLISISVFIIIISLLGVNEIISILLGGIVGTLFIYLTEHKNSLNSLSPLALIFLPLATALFHLIEKSNVTLTKLFLTCLKIGSVWYGSGYVLVAYFDGEFVQGLNWLTRNQLLDAIAVGQITPGPFLSSATFIGYQIAGLAGALTATAGIILPSFIFVFILNPLIPRLRRSYFFSKFLDAVNVSAIAVMFVVAIKLGVEVLTDWQSIIIAVISIIVFFTIKKINAAFIIISSAVLGYILYLFN